MVSHHEVPMEVGQLLGDGDVIAHRHVPEPGRVGRSGDRRQLVGAGLGLPRLGVQRALGLDRQLHADHEPARRKDRRHDLTGCQIGAAVATADGLPPRPAH